MTVNKGLLWFAIGAAALVSAGIFGWAQSGSAFKVCVPTEGAATTQHQEAIKALDAVADVGIKLSTTLVGLGAAILLGFKSGLTLTTPIRASILLATVCFLESALYAVLWRMRIAELWINDCLALVEEPRLQYRFMAHFGFFLAGLGFLAFLVVSAALTASKPAQGGES
ncbi:hypothetical protein [Bradyrhizobium sp. 2S1]|uniref:hypothetical protein n=1 Tax=Bradyrhizobium sp. 2S1 TaxID=1404429 RepID=UPI00140B8CCE|nr:hypothetical protein [Bradyrhizobium sp. 2S1]MCK7665825.1 hypothetical protein [Bradyrhizobium sp. 2S1]